MTLPIITGTMVDTETLSLGDRALPWEVAAVRFSIDLNGDAPAVEIGPSILALVDFNGRSTRGFDIDLQTVAWTNKQRAGDAGWDWWRRRHIEQAEVLAPSGLTIATPQQLWRMLDRITGEGDPVHFRNSAFDPPLLAHFFAQTGQGPELPWNRRRQSDSYSFVNFAKMVHGYEDNLPKVTGHRALEDCLGQIDQLADVLHLIHMGGKRPEPDTGSIPAL